MDKENDKDGLPDGDDALEGKKPVKDTGGSLPKLYKEIYTEEMKGNLKGLLLNWLFLTRSNILHTVNYLQNTDATPTNPVRGSDGMIDISVTNKKF